MHVGTRSANARGGSGRLDTLSGIETIFDTAPQYLVTCAILTAAGTVYVVLGFGVGLIAVGCLALVLPDVRDVVVLLFFVTVPAEVYVVASGWRMIRWRVVLPVCSGIVVGVPLGTWVLRFGEPSFLLLLLGLLLVAAGTAFLGLGERRGVRAPGWVGPSVGLMSGVLGGMLGTGGPPLILYYQLSGADKSTFRQSLMVIFLLVTLVRLPTYALSGLLTPARAWSGLAVVPTALLGVWLGSRLHVRVSEAGFRRLVSLALVLLGGLLLARQLV